MVCYAFLDQQGQTTVLSAARHEVFPCKEVTVFHGSDVTFCVKQKSEREIYLLHK